MSRRSPREAPEVWWVQLAQWATLWRLPGLEDRLTIRVSTRLRTSLGRCAPARGELRIAAYLLDAPNVLVEEVLCHEAAHAATYELHGRAARPHGPEWRALMRAAGFVPRTRVAAEDLAALPGPVQRGRKLWEHRCPACGARWLAGRPVQRWRCGTCRARGLEGRLEIARSPAPPTA